MHLQGRARRWVLRRGLCSASRTVWLHLLVSAFCETARPANTGTAQGSPHRARHSSDQGLQGWGCQGRCHTAPQALTSRCPADAVGPGCVSAASSPPSASLPLPKSRWILHRPTPAPGAPSYPNLLHQDPGPTRGPGALPCPRHPLQPPDTPSLPRPDPRGWGRALQAVGVLAARNKAIFLSVPGCSGSVSTLSPVRSQSWARAALGQPLPPSPSSEQQPQSPRPRLILLAPHLAAGPLGGGKLLRSAASRGGPEPPGRSPTQPGQRQQRRADVWKPGTAGGGPVRPPPGVRLQGQGWTQPGTHFLSRLLCRAWLAAAGAPPGRAFLGCQGRIWAAWGSARLERAARPLHGELQGGERG